VQPVVGYLLDDELGFKLQPGTQKSGQKLKAMKILV